MEWSNPPSQFWYLQPLGVLQDYFKPEKPLKVLATLNTSEESIYIYTYKGCKYVPAHSTTPRGF
jgi:hypothetical protein